MHLGAGIPVCSDCRERLSMLFLGMCVCVGGGGGRNEYHDDMENWSWAVE